MRISRSLILKAVCLVLLGFVAGIAFQKFYSIDALLRDVGLRNELTDQLSGRKPVRLPSPLSANKMVAIAFGQSNAANFGKVRHVSLEGSYNFFAGELYPARDPMIGASGMGGSVWTRLGDRLISDSRYDLVVFATLGVSASKIARWAPGGDLHPKLLETIRSMTQSGFVITHLLWHQGETDARLGTSAEEYKRLFLSMLESLRAHGVTAHIYVSVTTRCYENNGDDDLKNAQRQLVDPGAGILSGPDTDTLGPEYRHDDCHFSEKGLLAAADLWYDALTDGQPHHLR